MNNKHIQVDKNQQIGKNIECHSRLGFCILAHCPVLQCFAITPHTCDFTQNSKTQTKSPELLWRYGP